MMEILFRGKCTDTGEWLMGDLIRSQPNGLGERVPFIGKMEIYCFNLEADEVIPGTIGQFTGLTDKNGMRIFEGDILAAKYPEQTRSVPGVVKFGEFVDVDSADTYHYLGWHIEVLGSSISILEPSSDGIEIEVIGNIHDNPEMLEVSKE